VYSRGEGKCSPPLDTVHCAKHRWKYRRIENRQCIPKANGTVPLPLVVFIMHNTDGNIDGLKTIDVF